MDNRNEIEKFVVLWKMVTLVLAANAMQQRGENNSKYYDAVQLTHTPRPLSLIFISHIFIAYSRHDNKILILRVFDFDQA
jgi:hypothetical protein